MAKCKHQLNGIPLTDKEVYELEMDALRSLEQELTGIERIPKLSREKMFNMLVDNEIINKQIFKKEHIRIPRGRFASDRIQEQAIRRLENYNQFIRNVYMVDFDVVTLKPTQTGFDVEIHDDRIAQANNVIEKWENEPFSKEMIEQRMTEILFNRNQVEGYESFDIRTDMKIAESVNDKVNKMIIYKKSLQSMLESRLGIINAEMKTIKHNEPQYALLEKRKKEIELRLWGKGSKQELGTNYVTNLQDEIKELEQRQSTADVAIDSLRIEVDRVHEILKRIEQGEFRPDFLSDIVEARMLMNIINASSVRSQSLTPEVPENPFLTLGNIRALQHESVFEQLSASEQQKLKHLASKIEGVINLAHNTHKLYSRIVRIENDLIEKIARDDDKINKVYNENELSSAILFQDRPDVNAYDFVVSDGITTSFDSLGPIPQLVKNLLEKKTNEYKSKTSIWKEKMDGMMGKVNAELNRLGYGIGFIGEQNLKANIFGVSYKLFRQQNSDGTPTNRLVDRMSAKFYEKERAMRDSHRRARQSRDAGKIRQADIRYRNFRRKNQVLVDIRKILTPSELGLDRYNEFLVSDNTIREKLLRHLGSDAAVDAVIEQAKQTAVAYHADYERKIQDVLDEYGVDSVDELDIDGIAELDRFEAKNNPFLAANLFVNNNNAGLQAGGYPVEPSNRYSVFVPRRYKTDGELKKMPNGEFDYAETNEDTGYYDKNFELIESNPVLKEFYTLAKEIMNTTTSWLPPSDQQQLMDNAFLGLRKTVKEVLLDPDAPMWFKLTKSTRMILDNLKNAFQIQREGETFFGNIDPYNRTILPSVRTQYINTNKMEIQRKMTIGGGMFTSLLTQETESEVYDENDNLVPHTRTSNKALNFFKDKGKVVFKRSSVIPYNLITPEARSLLADWLGIENNELALRDKLELQNDTDYVPVGRILERAIVSEIATDESYNMPKMLNLMMTAASTYAARNDALPMLNIIKNRYKEIKQLMTVDVDGKTTPVKKKHTKVTGEELNTTLVREKRKHATTLMDKFFERNIEGKSPKGWGKIQTKSFHLKSDEKALNDMAQKVIDEQLNLPENQRDADLIQRMQQLQQNLGSQFAISRVVDQFLNLARFTGLALNPKSGITNYVAGKVSNWINASTGRYYSEDAFWRAERIVLGSHLKLAFGWLPGKPSTKSSRKAAILMSRFRVFQDASDEIYKSSVDTAVKYEKQGNVYFVQQRVEYVNQAPILVAMLIDKQITGKNGTQSSVWDAMDATGKLTENFRTEENVNTWESADSNDFDTFKSKIDTAIKNLHGDYTAVGAPAHSSNQIFRILAMFGRWKIRYIHARFSEEVADSELGQKFRGRFRSFTPASLTAATTLMGLGVLGLNPFVFAAAGIGYGAGYWLNRKNGMERPRIDIDFMKDFGAYLGKIAGQALTNPLRVPINTITGRNLLGNTKFGHLLTDVDEHTDPEMGGQYNNDLRANITEVSIMTTALLMRLMFLYYKNMDDDEEDKDKAEEQDELIYLMNLCGEVHNDLFDFYAIVPGALRLLEPAFVRMAKRINTLVTSVDEYNEKYVYGPYKGKTKFRYMLETTLLPAAGRTKFGFRSSMEKVYEEYGFEKLLQPQSKVNTEKATQIRAGLRNELLEMSNNSITDAMREAAVDKLLEERKIPRDKAERQVKRDFEKIALKYINGYINETIPTARAIQKNDAKEILTTIRIEDPDILQDEVKTRKRIHKLVEERIKEREEFIEYLRKNEMLEQEFISYVKIRKRKER